MQEGESNGAYVFGGVRRGLLLNAGSPGPSVAALVMRVITNGWRDVLPFLGAMWIGEVIWLTMAVAGLTALAQTFQVGFAVIKWLGVVYLLWLAVKMWRHPGAGHDAEVPQRTAPLSMFGAGLAVTMGNPKIMVFYLALLPTLIDLSSVGVSQWAILAVTTFGTLACIDLSWTLFAHKARGLFRTPRAMRLSNRVGAMTLGGVALMIAARD